MRAYTWRNIMVPFFLTFCEKKQNSIGVVAGGGVGIEGVLGFVLILIFLHFYRDDLFIK